MCILLPFANNKYAEYILESPQELKYHLSEHIMHELFFSKLLKTVQSIKNIVNIQDAVDYFSSQDEVS